MPLTPRAFGGWRAFFWPIHRSEWRIFFPLLGMFFLISFNYSLLHAFKDSLLITAPQSGAEALPFVKVWAILPGAVLLTWAFTRLSHRRSREEVFYWMLGGFLVFFAVFACILYPCRESLHPHALADFLQSVLPAGCKGLIAVLRNWTFSLFYMMSELWSTAIMSVLFWKFANEIVRVDEAKRYYGLFMVGANIATVCAGYFSIWLSDLSYASFIPYGLCKWEQSVLFLNCAILGSGGGILLLFRWLTLRAQLPKEHALTLSASRTGLRESLAYLTRSPYLLCIAIMVIAYNIAMNLIEVVWKDQINAFYPDPSDFMAYMGRITIVIGIVAAVVSALLTGNFLRRFSWTANALIPVGAMVLSGGAFFVSSLFSASETTALFNITPAALCLILGAVQNICGRTCKYTFFDTTKEIAFIPLDGESKLKGKAVIDGVGSRLGKSGGSLIHQGFLLCFTTISASTPYIAGLFLAVVALWGFATFSLGRRFNLLTGKEPASVG